MSTTSSQIVQDNRERGKKTEEIDKADVVNVNT